jgi:hypothetical protein
VHVSQATGTGGRNRTRRLAESDRRIDLVHATATEPRSIRHTSSGTLHLSPGGRGFGME